MSRKPNLDKFHDVLFKDFDEQKHLNLSEQKQLMRFRAAFTMSLENPSIPDTVLRDYLIEEFGISTTQAYADIGNVRILLGNVRNAGKEWVRYLVNETLKKAIEDARALGSKGIVLAIMAADKLGKYNRLDREDAETLPWEEIVPVPIEPTSDPTVLGIKPLENKEEVIRNMYEKYKGEIEIEDIGYEELPDGRD
jgi:hypothetical protein